MFKRGQTSFKRVLHSFAEGTDPSAEIQYDLPQYTIYGVPMVFRSIYIHRQMPSSSGIHLDDAPPIWGFDIDVHMLSSLHHIAFY